MEEVKLYWPNLDGWYYFNTIGSFGMNWSFQVQMYPGSLQNNLYTKIKVTSCCVGKTDGSSDVLSEKFKVCSHSAVLITVAKVFQCEFTADCS